MENGLINISTTSDKVLLGNPIIELVDESVDQFRTDRLDNFISYLDKIGCLVYIGETCIEAYLDDEPAALDLHPVAICSLQSHPGFECLKYHQGAKINIDMFITFLQRMKPYLTADSLNLLSNLRALKIQKVIEVNRKDDKRGNFLFSVRAESGGNNDYMFPECLTFAVPLILNCKDLLNISFDLSFDWSVEKDNGFKFTLMIENFEFANIVRERKQEILASALKVDGLTVYFGTYHIIKQTDEWKYKKNDLVAKGL